MHAVCMIPAFEGIVSGTADHPIVTVSTDEVVMAPESEQANTIPKIRVHAVVVGSAEQMIPVTLSIKDVIAGIAINPVGPPAAEDHSCIFADIFIPPVVVVAKKSEMDGCHGVPPVADDGCLPSVAKRSVAPACSMVSTARRSSECNRKKTALNSIRAQEMPADRHRAAN